MALKFPDTPEYFAGGCLWHISELKGAQSGSCNSKVIGTWAFLIILLLVL